MAPAFDLILNLTPAFHRPCSIRIEGDATGSATFEACPAGLLPGAALTLSVESAQMQALYASCLHMLSTWDPRWSQAGLDGISIDGVFDTPDAPPQAFTLWSPGKGSTAHAMLAAAMDCFPAERCSGVVDAQLAIIRSYFGLQPPVTVIKDTPLCLRLAPWVHHTDREAIAKRLSTLAPELDLIIDVSGVERFGRALLNILPMTQLLKRSGSVRWIAQSAEADVLVAYGVAPSAIEVVQRTPISRTGEPIVLGSIAVSSEKLLALANSGAKIELIRAFRQDYPQLTMEQAARAAGELLAILATASDADH